MNKYKSFGITVRPRNGIPSNGVLETSLIKYCKKQDFCSYVFEKEYEARHCHIQLFFNEGKYKGDIKKQFLRICEANIPDWDLAQKKVCILVRICYNNWIENYCIENDIKKEEYSDNCVINVPLDEQNYYPSEEEQAKANAKSNAVDQRFHNYVELYNEHPEFKDCKYPTMFMCAKFMNDIMFVSKKIPVIIDDKARRNVVRCFHSYYRGYFDHKMFLDKDEVTLANTQHSIHLHAQNL